MLELTKAQQRVLTKLKASWWQQGKQPVLSEVAADLGMHYVSFKQHLEALERKNYLTFETKGRGKPPVLTLTGNDDRGVPLVGEIAAGGLHAAEQEIEAYLKLPAHGRFALRVKGDSMAEAIQSGDVVVLEQRPAVSGDVCAVYVDEETTLKRIYIEGERTQLKPNNPDYPVLEVPTVELHVQGVLYALIRGFLIDDLISEGNEAYLN